jgi:ATP-dependent exoDNAse (exonuclease V) alpha subunit
VDRHNEACLKRVPGELHVYHAINKASPEMHEKFPQLSNAEYMWAFEKNGILNSVLELKVGAIVMIIRNLLVSIGLANGTKAVVTAIYERFIEVETIPADPDRQPVTAFIPRIIFEVKMDDASSFHRRQFPVRLAYAATVNKAQGQTIEKAVYDTQEADIFAHGQCYVAFSRVRKREDILVLNNKTHHITNVVHREVFPEQLQEQIHVMEAEKAKNELKELYDLNRPSNW